ncbi:MAG: serine/threonine protein kinase [Myxococcales bacterium]|nr:serine/threonine protein kinase [Myxococcales bacterium]
MGGAYRVVRALDSGGMGQVYEAEHIRLRRRLAVKIMAGHLAQDANALARFHREAEIVSQLEHPHIVQVVDFDTTPQGQPFLVMEFLRGTSLEARLHQGTLLPVAEALKIATQAAAGLAAAHILGVVHRDLKPANVFLVDGKASGWPDELFVKLLDFGISKRADQKRGLTGEFDILGTPDYMAPEQALGKTAAVDHRGDQFSLAVITYEMLTGVLPFAADEVMEVLQRVIRDTPSAPSALRPELPREIDGVLLQALSKRPEDRFPSIMDFAEALNVAGGRFGQQNIPAPRPLTSPPPPRPAEAALTLTSPPAPPPNTPPRSTPPRSTPPRSTRPYGLSQPPPGGSKSTPPRPRPRMTSWAHEDPAETIRELVERTRQELGLDNPEMAVRYAEAALSLADELGSRPDVAAAARDSETLFRRVFERYIGRLDSILVIGDIPSGQSKLSPQQAFLLSRIEGTLSVEEAIDLSPLPRLQTLRHLADLLSAGHLHLDRTSTDRTTSRRRGP